MNTPMTKAFLFSMLFVICISLSQLLAQPVPPTAPPTTQQLAQLLADKQYTTVLQDASQMLRVKSTPANPVDKYDIYMLRAEAQLQLKQQAGALESYRLAMKETTDPTQSGIAKWTMTLVQQSRNFMYTPKTSGDPTKSVAPISILDPASRKMAFSALFDDQWKPAQAKIDALKKQSTALPPLLQAASLAGEMRGLEMAATGTDTQTSTALADLTDNAAKLMNDYLDRSAKRVDAIDASANTPSDNMPSTTTRRGLSGMQGNELRDILATCQKLNLAAKQVASSGGSASSTFKTIADKSEQVGTEADKILNTDYTAYVDPNANQPVRTGGQPMRPNMPPRRY